MRKLFLILILCFPFIDSSAQLNTKEKGFNLDLGLGATLHNIFNNVNGGNGGSAFARLVHINARYKDGILAYGLKLEHYNFITKNDSSEVFTNAVANFLQFNTTVTIIEKKKFSFYLNPGVGVGNLHYERLDTNGVYGKIKMQGFSASASAGINYHFSAKFGVFVQLGYVYSVQHLTDFRVNGTYIAEFEERPLGEVIFNLRGMDFKTGIRFAF